MRWIAGYMWAAVVIVGTAAADVLPPPDEGLSGAALPLLVMAMTLAVGLLALLLTRRRPDRRPGPREPAHRHATAVRAARLK